MSEMGFGYYTGDLGDNQDGEDLNQQTPQQPGQKSGLRQYLDKLEERTKEQDKLIQQLLGESRRNKVADALEAKGYDRGVAALYQGDPDKVDEWLTTAGNFLAKKDGVQTPPANQAPPADSTIPPEGQAQMQQFQQAGQNAAPPAGSDAEQAAFMATIDDPQKLTDYLASQGNEFARYWNG